MNFGITRAADTKIADALNLVYKLICVLKILLVGEDEALGDISPKRENIININRLDSDFDISDSFENYENIKAVLLYFLDRLGYDKADANKLIKDGFDSAISRTTALVFSRFSHFFGGNTSKETVTLLSFKILLIFILSPQS